MNSKTVNAAIAQTIWPILKDAGFNAFRARSAWRKRDQTVEVVNFQSFNASLAERLGCTTLSFSINLGVYYLCVHKTPWVNRWPPVYPTPPDEPEESACHARRQLTKELKQKQFPRADIWYLDLDGANLSEVIADARQTIQTIGLPSLAQFSDLRYALTQYLHPRQKNHPEFVPPLGTLGDADVGSALALALNDLISARKLWQELIANRYYARNSDILDRANQTLAMLK